MDIDNYTFMEDDEFGDDFAEFVAGGVYSEEEWKNMTPEERMEAWRVSKINRAMHQYCQLD